MTLLSMRGGGRSLCIALLTVAFSLMGISCSEKSDEERGILRLDAEQCAGYVKREHLVKPVGFREGIGFISQKISTRSKKAQKFYNQGLNYLNTYNWIEAIRSFHEALRHDDRLAMAHLGLARSYEGVDSMVDSQFHLNRAAEIAKRKRLSKKEKQWISLMVWRNQVLGESIDKQEAEIENYQLALEKIIRLDGDDPSPWIFLGHSKSLDMEAIGRTGGEETLRYYQAALNRHREHTGAHLFLSHSYENIGDFQKAAFHADVMIYYSPELPQGYTRLAEMLPLIGKADEALEFFLKADKLHRDYFEREDIEPWNDWHFSENLRLMGGLLIKQGKETEAEDTLNEVNLLFEHNFCREVI